MSAPELNRADLLQPQWSVSPRVQALVTTRNGGVSAPPYGRWKPADHASDGGEDRPGGLNLGLHTGDDPAHVALNRARLLAHVGTDAAWLEQVHGADVADAHEVLRLARAGAAPARADASVAAGPGVACVVMVADCMPVLLCDRDGRAVGAAHAGWRGLAGGVVEATARRVAALAGTQPAELHAYLGPAIGPQAFEVGAEVREAFLAGAPLSMRAAIDAAFVARPGQPGKYLADLAAIARLRLAAFGLDPAHISGGDYCTVSERERFYSYRRERVTGRMAALIWLAD